MTPPRRRGWVFRLGYGFLTAVFAVGVVATVGTWLLFVGLTAYDFAPGSEDRPASPGVLEGHPQVLRLAIIATAVTVGTALVLAVLDRFRD